MKRTDSGIAFTIPTRIEGIVDSLARVRNRASLLRFLVEEHSLDENKYNQPSQNYPSKVISMLEITSNEKYNRQSNKYPRTTTLSHSITPRLLHA
ncbi:MAG: hypothetical protein NTW50_03450 [Candidatus Berkelbacteria bacterium]|nr:hypothetical protein [Candidatus Berkelbacteria bacterium]